MLARRKTRGSIHSIEVFNEMDEQCHWIACTYSLWDWVLLRPSSRGHFRVKKKDTRNVKNQWKGRIKAFRYSYHLPAWRSSFSMCTCTKSWPSVEIKCLAINPTVSVYFCAYFCVYFCANFKERGFLHTIYVHKCATWKCS